MKKYSLTVTFIITISCFFSFSQPGIKASIERGKDVYKKNCLACHQANGEGVPDMNPPLVKTQYVLGNKKKLITIVMKGTNEGVVINGDTYDNPMPAQPQLTDQQVADVLTYVRNSFGNKGSAITVTEVKAVRTK